MADNLKRLSGPLLLTGSAATVYTTPALTTATVRTVHVCNETGTAATFTLSLGADGAGKRLFMAITVPANGVLVLGTNVILAAAEILQAYSGTASALTVTISGVEST
jgi:hypothetical protein